MKIKITLTILAVIGVCLLIRASETVPQTQTALKSYFNPAGAVPGTNAYNEWIDTMFYYINAIYTNSQAARSNAAVAAASFGYVRKAAGNLHFIRTGNGSGGYVMTATNLVNIRPTAATNFVFTHGGFTWTVRATLYYSNAVATNMINNILWSYQSAVSNNDYFAAPAQIANSFPDSNRIIFSFTGADDSTFDSTFDFWLQ